MTATQAGQGIAARRAEPGLKKGIKDVKGLKLKQGLAALLAGTVFGAGLAMAQMTDPRKVLGFLDIAGAWDASLLFVMGGGVLLATVGFFFVRKRRSPVFDHDFHLPTRTRIDRPLLIGSALFGAGWGLAGYCPGPAISSLGLFNAEALWVVPAMFAGFALQRWRRRIDPKLSGENPPGA